MLEEKKILKLEELQEELEEDDKLKLLLTYTKIFLF
jgi:hypothetical protein